MYSVEEDGQSVDGITSHVSPDTSSCHTAPVTSGHVMLRQFVKVENIILASRGGAKVTIGRVKHHT